MRNRPATRLAQPDTASVQQSVMDRCRLQHCARGETIPSVGDPSLTDIDLSQEDIAGLASVPRTTLNAVLHDLKARGRLERLCRRIRFLTPGAMRAMLGD